MPRQLAPNARSIADIKFPVKKDGTPDRRYVLPQVVKNNGKRDMRTMKTADRIKTAARK